MISYQAPNPYPREESAFSAFFSRLFSSASVGASILPALGRQATTIASREMAQLQQKFSVKVDSGYVNTFDGATLETIEVVPSQASHRYIIKFNGNGGQYQDLLEEFAHDAKALNATVVGFNYRGVGNSSLTPKIYRNLETDGIAQVQRLLDAGVSSEHILLDGHSLGGSIATMVAKYFHDKGQPVYLWNDRSLSTLARAAAGIVAPSSHACTEDMVATSSCVALSSTGWNVDVARAYKAIPAQYKGYMFVSKKAGGGLGDGVISHRASLHRAVKAHEVRTGEHTGHKVSILYGRGHNVPRALLFSKSTPGKNGQEVYEDFVKAHLKP